MGKLHAAYARRWRFQVATLRDRRRNFEAEEEVRFLSSSFGVCMQVMFRVSGGGRGDGEGTRTENHLTASETITAVSTNVACCMQVDAFGPTSYEVGGCLGTYTVFPAYLVGVTVTHADISHPVLQFVSREELSSVLLVASTCRLRSLHRALSFPHGIRPYPFVVLHLDSLLGVIVSGTEGPREQGSRGSTQ